MNIPVGGVSGRPRLLALSFLTLFVELALIRWLGSNVLYLSYFSNFVLLGSFLGIGVGFLRARATTPPFTWAPVALALLVAFVEVSPVTAAQSEGGNLIFFTSLTTTGLPIWVMLPVIFLAVAAVMATIAGETARSFVTFAPLEAYRLDIAGSLAGIAAFSLLSFLSAPPLAWAVVTALTFGLLFAPRVPARPLLALIALVGILGAESFLPGRLWSPYYKIALQAQGSGDGRVVSVSVNGVPHQAITSVALRQSTEPIYFLPYRRVTRLPLDVLIVGAGTGTDVAIALARGAHHVDAVEIDPQLQALGRELHPDRPYDDPRVEVHINDGRAFLEQSDRRWDLILFALPDSITLVAGQSSLRLESYLFTAEAMATARAHLRPGGAFGQYNFYREPWLVDRLAATLAAAYGRAPCLDTRGLRNSVLLMDSTDPGAIACPDQWRPGAAAVPAASTDDYPFLYLRDRGIPGVYLLSGALILGLSFAAIGLVARQRLRSLGQYADLFFMGAAFLLLETKNVVQFALLFGTTWLVNALVFAGVLTSILAAVEVARRVTIRHPWRLYPLLFATLAVAWLVPAGDLLAFAVLPRFALGAALAFAPIFIANLVFAQRFRSTGASEVAFAANLVGSMVGGLVEYVALATGYRTLLLIAALLYALALATGRRHLVAVARAS